MLQHTLPIRVYYEDTDCGGLVYHANYLKFFERARTEALRACGFELNKLLPELNIQFVVRRMELQFLQPARLDQLLYIVTKVTEVGFASVKYNQQVRLEAVEGLLLCEANLQLACINANYRPTGLPDNLLKRIKE